MEDMRQNIHESARFLRPRGFNKLKIGCAGLAARLYPDN